MHEKQWLSNVLDLAEANGLYVKGSRDLSRINEMSGEGFYKNVVDFNKRTQLLHDKGVPMPEGIIPRRELAIFDDIIFEEYTGLDKNNKPEKGSLIVTLMELYISFQKNLIEFNKN